MNIKPVSFMMCVLLLLLLLLLLLHLNTALSTAPV
jgi:hypothetical protein